LSTSTVILNGENLTPENVRGVARDFTPVELASEALHKVERSRAVVDRLLEARAVVYGLTTGFGSLRDILIPPEHVTRLQQNLIRSHSAGVGPPAPEDVVRAMLVLRANTLARGYSGVRPVVIETLVRMLNARVYPVVPLQGSLGASGDLAPLSHLALVLMGEGEAFLPDGRRVPGAEAMRVAGIPPVVLQAKEGLALNNGTQFMTAVGVLALLDAECLVHAAVLACALSLEAVKGVSRALDPRLHAVRPHPGQVAVARAIRRQLEGSEILALPVNTARVHTAGTFLEAAESVLGRETSERCLTAAEGISNLRGELSALLGAVRERIDMELGRVRSGGEPEDEARRAAAARVLARHVLALQGIYEQVLSGALPPSAAVARGYLEQALHELQRAVPSFLPVQDDYSFRCAPQVIGPALDTFVRTNEVFGLELNAATDNPLIFPPEGGPEDPAAYARALSVTECKEAVVSGGNFHGEPVSLALDQACLAIAEVGSISERRTFHLVSRHLSNGLPPFLIRDVGLQSGLMLAQYTAAALVSENKTLCHPAVVDSIPTSEDVEDHVSMGAWAARKFAAVVENVYRIVAVELICAAQGVELRRPARASRANEELLTEVRKVCPPFTEDRPPGPDIERVADLIRGRALEVLRGERD
jgi:histidine ammonia-lyase